VLAEGQQPRAEVVEAGEVVSVSALRGAAGRPSAAAFAGLLLPLLLPLLTDNEGRTMPPTRKKPS